jgi:F0F1-type ATP synthase membrane subunit a
MGEHLAIGIFLSLVIMPGALDLVLGTTKVLAWSSSVFAITIGALTGFIQAMIFAVLTISYISTAVSDEH